MGCGFSGRGGGLCGGEVALCGSIYLSGGSGACAPIVGSSDGETMRTPHVMAYLGGKRRRNGILKVILISLRA